MEGVAESMYKKLTKMRDGGLVVLSRRSLQFLVGEGDGRERGRNCMDRQVRRFELFISR